MSDDEGRSILHYQLSELLGFDDGVADVIEMLLSIESREDLEDYLSQLLGSSNPTGIQDFVESVVRYQRGEKLTPVATAAAAAQTSRNVAVDKQNVPKESKPPPKAKKQPKARSQPPPAQKKEAKQAVSNVKKPKAATTPKPAPQPASTKPAAVATPQPETPTKTKQVSVQKMLSSLPKGKAKVVCGCFGSIHKALTNCLRCGRISCAKEGYSFCPFCDHLVDPENRRDLVSEEAWKLQEQMLERDLATSRKHHTQVLDDQGDYYQSRAWSTAQEEQDANEREADRYQQLHQRQKMQLNVAL